MIAFAEIDWLWCTDGNHTNSSRQWLYDRHGGITARRALIYRLRYLRACRELDAPGTLPARSTKSSNLAIPAIVGDVVKHKRNQL